MYTRRAIVAGAESPLILGSIATPVLNPASKSRDALDFLASEDPEGARVGLGVSREAVFPRFSARKRPSA